MRRLVLSVLTVTSMVPAGVAWAGGAVWEFEGYHRPGDRVESTTSVEWDHDPSLGRPKEGPFFVYLAPNDWMPKSWPPDIPDEAFLVGSVEVRTGPYWADGMSMGPHHAIARFEIPDVPAGIYQVLHCNDPCTTTLGDIVGGWDLRVLPGEEGRNAAAIAAEVEEIASSRAATEKAPRVVEIRVTALIGSQLVAV